MLVIFAAPSFGWGAVMTAKELGQLTHARVELGIDVHRARDAEVWLGGAHASTVK